MMFARSEGPGQAAFLLFSHGFNMSVVISSVHAHDRRTATPLRGHTSAGPGILP